MVKYICKASCVFSVAVLLSSFFALNAAAAAAPSDSAKSKFSDWGKTQTLTKKKGALTINLQSNRTTGFRWVLVKSSSWLRPISQKYKEDKHAKGMTGVGGTEVWKFKLKRHIKPVSRLGKLCFRYVRVWEASSSSDKPKCFTVAYSPK